MQREQDPAFSEWAERKWTHAYANGAVIFPGVVHVSNACLEQARAAYPPDADVEYGVCFKIAANYYYDLRAKYRAGQVRHELAPQ